MGSLRLRGALIGAALLLAVPATATAHAPTTGFEQRGGASWTTHEEELDFLAHVDRDSGRARVEAIGTTIAGRPLHLVRLGAPKPRSAARARREPTILYVCSQHGNEPAGREACLQLLRDLAFSADPAVAALLEQSTVLFVPTANPDGRAANTRGNANGTDINRDHLNLSTPEAQAIAAVVRDFQPDAVLDLHEYGPSQPVVYDDDVLLLWPRNLNVHQDVHDLSLELVDGLAAAAEAAGYSADEYGQQRIGDRDYHIDVAQTAGDGDEGIARNTMGLRHSLGILAETRVDFDITNSIEEALQSAAVNRRRVHSHSVIAAEGLRFLGERGDEAAAVTRAAAIAKAKEGAERSAPVYFGGADNQDPAADQIVEPPPCGYALTAEQYGEVAGTLALLGAKPRVEADGGATVSMAQAAEPVIPLLLDSRGARSAVAGTPLDGC